MDLRLDDDVPRAFHPAVVEVVRPEVPLADDGAGPVSVHAADGDVPLAVDAAVADVAMDMHPLGGGDVETVEHVAMDLHHPVEIHRTYPEVDVACHAVFLHDRDFIAGVPHPTGRCREQNLPLLVGGHVRADLQLERSAVLRNRHLAGRAGEAVDCGYVRIAQERSGGAG